MFGKASNIFFSFPKAITQKCDFSVFFILVTCENLVELLSTIFSVKYQMLAFVLILIK